MACFRKGSIRMKIFLRRLLQTIPLFALLTPGVAPAATAAAFTPPKFVIGVFLQPNYKLADWRQRGINTAFGYETLGGTVSNADWSAAAAAQGMAYIREAGTDLAADARDPHLLAWLQPDEPELNKIAPSLLAANYAKWKAAGPNVPVILNFSGGNIVLDLIPKSTFDQYLPTADQYANDFYPISGWGRLDWLYRVGQAVDVLGGWTGGKPQYAFIESNTDESPNRGAGTLTPDEFHSMAWNAVIHGVRGIIYFPQSFNGGFRYDSTPPAIVSEMTTLNSHLNDISATLARPANPSNIPVSVAAPLEAGWRATVTGKMVIVSNPTAQARPGVAINLGGNAGIAKVWWEARRVNIVAGGTMTDDFAPYAVHVYQIIQR